MRRSRGAGLALALVALVPVAGCGSDDGPPPDVTVACPPGAVEVTVTNRSERTQRYTVSVAFVRAGDIERESLSSNDVAAGATATITDSRPDEAQTCSIEKTEVFQ